MAYADLNTNERITYHETAISLNRQLERLNRRYLIALTSQERTALRQAAVPILAQLEAWTYASAQGTIPN